MCGGFFLAGNSPLTKSNAHAKAQFCTILMTTSSVGLGERYKKKIEDEFKKLLKCRCKQNNEQLYLLCMEIIDRFSDKENLHKCHHQMHSQKKTRL
jgi:hypothetical protein